MLLDDNKERYPILISLHKSGSTWINSFIHKRYRRIGLTPPPRNLYTEFFHNDYSGMTNVFEDKDTNYVFTEKTNEERIALLEQLRTFGLELNQKAHVPEIMPLWPWFKEFYKDYDILVCKRRNIFSHWINMLFFFCIKKATNGVTEIITPEQTTGIIPSKISSDYDEDILKSTIQQYKVQFKFNAVWFRDFVHNIRFLNDVVIKELDKPQVIWLEDIDHAWLEKRFNVTVKKTVTPFKTIQIANYFKPKDMAIIKEKFEERFYNEFQFFGYEYK